MEKRHRVFNPSQVRTVDAEPSRSLSCTRVPLSDRLLTVIKAFVGRRVAGRLVVVGAIWGENTMVVDNAQPLPPVRDRKEESPTCGLCAGSRANRDGRVDRRGISVSRTLGNCFLWGVFVCTGCSGFYLISCPHIYFGRMNVRQ